MAYKSSTPCLVGMSCVSSCFFLQKISAVVIVPLVNFPFLLTFCVLTSFVSRFECMFVMCTLCCVGVKINIILATSKIEYYNTVFLRL